MKKTFIQNWDVWVEFLIQAEHQNNIGTKEDSMLHSHIWTVRIEGQSNKLSKEHIVFNFKDISQFVFYTVNNKNLNDLLENRHKYISPKYVEYIEDIPNEPTNEVVEMLICRLVIAKITEENKDMRGIAVKVKLTKPDNIEKNVTTNKRIQSLDFITSAEYSCEEQIS